MEPQRKIDRQFERQTDRQTDSQSDRPTVSQTPRQKDLPLCSGISLRCAVLELSHPPTTRMKSTVFESTISETASCLSFNIEKREEKKRKG